MKTICSDCMLNYRQPVADFRPYAKQPGGKPDFDSLSEELKSKLVDDGEFYLERYTFPYLPASLYMEYQRTGNRYHFEDVCSRKRMALNSLVLAECVEKKGRFLDKITDGIYSICEETGWWLPAHNTYVVRQSDDRKPVPATSLPDPDRPVLDLFACETGGILGIVYYLLKDELGAVDPQVPVRIKEALESRIIRPYLTSFYWWMGDGAKEPNNWTPWCTMNVLLSCLPIGEPQDIRRRVLLQAAESLDYFLDVYHEDGYCNEGPAYYSHAGLDLAADLMILNEVTDGAFEKVSALPKVKNILSYICHVYAGNGYFINFSDCMARLGSTGLRELAAGEAFGLPDLERYGLIRFAENRKEKKAPGEDWRVTGQHIGIEQPDRYGTSEKTLYFRLVMLFTFAEAESKSQGLPAWAPGDYFFRDAGLLLVHSKHLFLAVKAGWNDDSHNHNDVGSFTVLKNETPMLIDAGVGDYQKKTFSDQRYEIWLTRSSYHNLPDIDGIEQPAGAQARAKDVSADTDGAGLRMNLREAYPGVDDDIIRHVRLERDQEQIVLKDTSGRPHQFCHHFMTWLKPEADSDGRGVTIGVLGHIAWKDPHKVTIEPVTFPDRRLKQVWGDAVYRVTVESDADSCEFVIS